MLAHLPYLVLPSQQQLTLHTSTITIGRNHSNMVVLRDRGVSDYHARLVRQGDTYVLEAAEGGYGIAINGRPIYTPTALRDGDEILLGTQRLVYCGNGRPRPGITYGYFLRIRSGALSGHRIDLTMQQARLGREPDNDIIIEEDQVSRHHLLLTREEDGYAIEDLHSTNGTFVNRHRVTNPRLLEDGDVITLGPNISLTYERAPLENRPDPKPMPHWNNGDINDTALYTSKLESQYASDVYETSEEIISPQKVSDKANAAKHDIFLSYCHRDTEIVSKIVKQLEAEGFSAWVDWQDLQPGTREWDREIKRALGNTKAVIAILSPDAEDSIWVARELAMAEMFDQRIYPVLVRGKTIDAIPIRLATHQFVDLRYNYELGINSLIQTLKLELMR